MYRYLLFGFNDYYPAGGMEDLKIKFNTIEEFENKFEFTDYDNWQLVDLNDFQIYEFSTSIMYHHGVDDYKEVIKKREAELINWVKSIWDTYCR
jgi:hypothetical protein